MKTFTTRYIFIWKKSSKLRNLRAINRQFNIYVTNCSHDRNWVFMECRGRLFASSDYNWQGFYFLSLHSISSVLLLTSRQSKKERHLWVNSWKHLHRLFKGIFSRHQPPKLYAQIGNVDEQISYLLSRETTTCCLNYQYHP